MPLAIPPARSPNAAAFANGVKRFDKTNVMIVVRFHAFQLPVASQEPGVSGVMARCGR